MKRILVFSLALALILSGAGALLFVKAHQKLGKPGVKVVPVSIFGEDGGIVADHSVYLPERVLDFSSIPTPISAAELITLPKDTTFGRRTYTNSAGFFFTSSIVLMGKDRTSIHKPQFCLTGQGWNISQSEICALKIEKPNPYVLPVMKLTLSQQQTGNSGQTIVRSGLYVYWFVSEKKLTAEHGRRVWSMVEELLKEGTLERWAYASYFTVCSPGEEEATFQKLAAVIQASVPEFQLPTGNLRPPAQQ